MLKEFREFAMRGNVVDMAIGIVIGGAFGKIVSSMVADVMMPPIGLVLGGVDFSNLFVVLKDGATKASPYVSLADAQAAGAVTLNYGMFINNIVSFTIVAFALFLVIKGMNTLRREAPAPPPAATQKECPQCATAIPIAAKRCPNCTSEIVALPV
jgi:large conductance mechanosensitive channel